MDAQDYDERKKKPHGNPNPRRGDIMRKIVKEVFGPTDPPATTGPHGGGGGSNGGGGGGGGGSDAADYGHD
ncbi:hypothetical protein ABZP36_006510 [Zizania latifolia]